MNIDLNQIEAMTTKDLEAHYGRLETEAFRLRVAISAVSLELEARIKSRRNTPLGVEEQTASGNTRLTLDRLMKTPAHPRAWGKCVCGQETCVECTDTLPVHCGEECETCDEEAAVRAGYESFKTEAIRRSRARRSDAGVPRGGFSAPRALDHSSCCGAEGRRMNTESLDCAACREVVE